MTAKILDFARPVNGVIVEQKRADGFINATAMCVAHGKDVSDWLKTDDAWETVAALAEDLGIDPKSHKSGNSVFTRVSAAFPSLVIVRRGSPEFKGGTWMHYDIALYLAQWCNKPFAIQVSRWIREWIETGKNPIQVDTEEEIANYEKRYSKRIELKDEHRVALMNVVTEWAQTHKLSPIKLCSDVHDVMNKRIQGYESQQIRAKGGLSMASLIRDYFGANILDVYGQINRIARNLIVDSGLDPIQATNKACDIYLSKSYVPTLTPILENLYVLGKSIKAQPKKKQLPVRKQLNFFDELQVS